MRIATDTNAYRRTCTSAHNHAHKYDVVHPKPLRTNTHMYIIHAYTHMEYIHKHTHAHRYSQIIRWAQSIYNMSSPLECSNSGDTYVAVTIFVQYSCEGTEANSQVPRLRMLRSCRSGSGVHR